jgi:hypothetical protein
MTEPDFYKILGVSPSASADAVKSAYRELVKKYHPDLFHSSAEKTAATDKLRQINEAYAVLGDAERRREYDERRVRDAAAAGAVSIRTAAASRRRRPKPPDPKPDKRAGYSVYAKLAGSILAVMIVAFLVNAVWDEPKPATVWVLFEKTVLEPPRSAAGRKAREPDWNPLGRYGSRAECAGGVRKLVQRDQQEGSEAIFDERDGTMAITVHITDQEALARKYLDAKLRQGSPGPAGSESPDHEALQQQAREEAREFVRQNGIARRVRNYECRYIQLPRPESWLRRNLRQIGLNS